jgi:hypothetical protein
MRAADDRGSADHPTRKTLAIALTATAAVLGLFLSYRHRPVVVPLEGAESLRAAASLLHHGHLDSNPQQPFAKFGVLYPLLLAALASTGLGPLEAMVLVNALVLVTSLLAFAALARRVTGRSALFAVPLFGGLAIHEYYFRQARLDAVVPAAGMLAILFASAYAERFRRRDLLATAAACAAATTVRYIGVIPLATVAVFVLGRSRSDPDGRFGRTALPRDRLGTDRGVVGAQPLAHGLSHGNVANRVASPGGGEQPGHERHRHREVVLFRLLRRPRDGRPGCAARHRDSSASADDRLAFVVVQ